ncbi:bifunctional diguanylate cyclase/phosphodiesterase [Thiohalophilus thiocyanatoxydans]|uniref:cyclic-guanylate-specific phosphodiesterase n=1 Tax=Thiohalophilus thiocyanatoxydans TaxID=381308 RepID=A0A4R8INN1_9GAMM|nr:EAL domain-containing protein [Thiohalophilus thiocyanatoxydans]TDX98175.1 PAS domain S-box-containing protein/diguanylate cyclase (GGDEF)-like protein [Thiohalophilus thiocyanatoxydans]
MSSSKKHTKASLLTENQRLRDKLAEYEQLINSIRKGEVDAILQTREEQSYVVSLLDEESIYRKLIEEMGEGALIISDQNIILYANQYIAKILQSPLHKIIGTAIDNWIFPDERDYLDNTLRNMADYYSGTVRHEYSLRSNTGSPIPAYLTIGKNSNENSDYTLSIIVTDLSEQKRNKAIAADEKLTRTILEQVTEAIVVCDSSGIILRSNATSRRLSETEPTGLSFDAIFQLIDKNDNLYQLKDILDNTVSGQLELSLRGKTRHFDLLVGSSYIRDIDSYNDIIGSVISLTDITHIKNTERDAVKANDQLQQQLQIAKRSRRALLNVVEDVKQSEKRLKNIASRLPGMIYEYQLFPDGSHRMPYVSDAISSLLGIDPESVHLDASPVFESIHPDDLARINISIKTSASELSIWRNEWRSIDKNGNIRWFNANATPDKQSDGSVLWHGFLTDVTERKAQESKVRLSAHVFENSREGIVITDKNNNIIMVNKAFTSITGYPEEEVLGITPNVLSSGQHKSDFYHNMWETISSQGYWEGEIWNRRKDGSIYPEWLSIIQTHDPEYNATVYIGIFEDITQRKEYEQHIQWLAHYDPLTKLPNRVLLSEHVEYAISQAQRQNKKIAILYCDLDNFKNINDSLGHKVGDLLLTEVAQRLSSLLRNQDTISRQGGDEFIILLPDTNADGSAHVAEKIQTEISKPYNINNYEMTATLSTGITIYPDDGDDFDTLSRYADIAMYHAKRLGGNNYFFYSTELQTITARTLKLEKDIRFAIDNQQLDIYYQPQVSLITGKISGLEALLRWNHPDFGMISPLEFIPIAENSGQILRIGGWVTRTATLQLKKWQATGIDPIKLSINLSVRELKQSQLVEKLENILTETGFEPGLLELEITESMLMEDQENIINTLNRINSLGVHLSIDDFGTGYSSLAYVKRLPVNQLKIDKSFVQDIMNDPGDAIIAQAIISLGHSLGMEVIAEGVEDTAQLDFLRSHGCDHIQGYLFSKPLPAGDIWKLLSDSETNKLTLIYSS